MVRRTEEEEDAEEGQTQALERGRAPGNKKDKKGTKGHKRAQAIEAKAEDARQNKRQKQGRASQTQKKTNQENTG